MKHATIALILALAGCTEPAGGIIAGADAESPPAAGIAMAVECTEFVRTTTYDDGRAEVYTSWEAVVDTQVRDTGSIPSVTAILCGREDFGSPVTLCPESATCDGPYSWAPAHCSVRPGGDFDLVGRLRVWCGYRHVITAADGSVSDAGFRYHAVSVRIDGE